MNSRLVGAVMVVGGSWAVAWGLTSPALPAAMLAVGAGVALVSLGISLVCEPRSRQGKRTRYKKG